MYNGYNVSAAVNYARTWAFQRNNRYYNFDGIGGDCTSFISQCLYAGCGVMNYTKDIGWYYNSANNRAAAWSSVEHLYKFLTTNKGKGPYGSVIGISQARIGDIIQLSFDGYKFAHSLLVTDIHNGKVFVTTHSHDSLDRDIDTYSYKNLRVIRINGVR